MLTKNEFMVIDLFRRDLFRSYTIREMMKKIGKETYTWTFNTVKKLSKLGIISIDEKGMSNICRINLDSPLAMTYLSVLDELEANSRNIPNVKELIEAVPLSFFTFIVTGSYAEGRQAKRSDIDIVVIVEDSCDTRAVLNTLKNKSDIMIPEIHSYVFKKSEFLGMLLSRDMNYGKLLFQKRLIFIGAENYYLTIKEAIRSGFKG